VEDRIREVAIWFTASPRSIHWPTSHDDHDLTTTTSNSKNTLIFITSSLDIFIPEVFYDFSEHFEKFSNF
jgi:hypothetical protein